MDRDTLIYEELTAPMLTKLKEENRVILLVFGSVEQHSTHLPVGTDFFCMEKRVNSIAELTGSIVFAPLKLGYSFNHLGMDGTVSVDAELFLKIVKEILLQLNSQGWKRFIIFSGHNGNWPALQLAVQIVKEKYQTAQILIAKGMPRMSDGHNRNRFVKNFDLHAGNVETALVKYYCENLIDYNNLPSGNRKLPLNMKEIINSADIDDIDVALISLLTPQHTSLLSDNGMWEINDLDRYDNIPVAEAMECYINFFVKLIKRWDEISK